MTAPLHSPAPVFRPTYVRHVVLAALCAVTAINYIQRNAVGPAETTMRADFNAGREETGDAIGAFFLGYALMQVPSGWLAQRLGGRLALTLFTAGWSLAVGLSALATGLPQLYACRLALGMLQAGIFPCATLILAVWYPSSQRGFASAMLTSFMVSGGAVCSVLTALLLGPLGWRLVFALYAVPGLAWAIVFAAWFRNRPEDHPEVNPAELALIRGEAASSSRPEDQSEVRAEGVPWMALLISPALWWLSLQQLCRSAALRFFDLSLPTFLQEAHGLTRERAGTLGSSTLWVAVLSTIVGGMISDFVLVRTGSRFAGRQGVAVVSLLLAIGCYVLAWVLAYPLASIYLGILALSVGSFFVNVASPCTYALSMDMGGRYTAIIFGTMNMGGNIGSWAFTTYVPVLVNKWGWDAALVAFVALHVAAIVLLLVLNPHGLLIPRSTDGKKSAL